VPSIGDRAPNEKSPAIARLQAYRSYFAPLFAGWLVLVPGPTLPWLEGFAATPFAGFMLAPVVVEEWCLCLYDLASAVRGEPTSPAIARAPIKILVFIIRVLLLAE
jgi:hypothetical protein